MDTADQLVEALERCPVSELVPLIPRMIEIVSKVHMQFSSAWCPVGRGRKKLTHRHQLSMIFVDR
jgi:hypothetical protein